MWSTAVAGFCVAAEPPMVVAAVNAMVPISNSAMQATLSRLLPLFVTVGVSGVVLLSLVAPAEVTLDTSAGWTATASGATGIAESVAPHDALARRFTVAVAPTAPISTKPYFRRSGLQESRYTLDDQALQHFARQVLVQTAGAGGFGGPPAHGAGIRPDRRIVVEVAQHRRVPDGGLQQSFEPSCDVGSYGIPLEGADQAAHGGLGHRAREVIGPEQGQAFGERPRRRGRRRQPGTLVCLNAGAELSLHGIGLRRHRGRCGRRHLARLALLAGQREAAGQRRSGIGQVDARLCVGRADLRQQPAWRIAPHD